MPPNRRINIAPAAEKKHANLRFDAPARTPGFDVKVAAPPESRGSLTTLRETAAHCRACPLWRTATQTVFGEGARRAPLLIVGEQPGHNEDLEGHPFVGPAGQLLEKAMALAGVEEDMVYLTNAVKHFKWELRGKRRMHKTPLQREISACQPWLEAEIQLVAPRMILCLGATAARAIVGGAVRVGEHRGQIIPTPYGVDALVTIHPAYVLRLQAGEGESAYRNLVEDIAHAAKLARNRSAKQAEQPAGH
jgi:uracil-DNA glycosylase